MCDQYERFFVAITDREQVRPASGDNYVIGHRWWGVPDIAASAEDFTPRRLAELAGAIAQGSTPTNQSTAVFDELGKGGPTSSACSRRRPAESVSRRG